jgi:hypothetical protein
VKKRKGKGRCQSEEIKETPLQERYIKDQMLQLARRWDIMQLNVLIDMKRERRSIMHMQQIPKITRQRMKNLYLSQHSRGLSLKEVILGL